jgi:hypothetical protein
MFNRKTSNLQMNIFKMFFQNLSLILIFIALACQKIDTSKLMEGDIIFQTSMSSQSEVIQIVTHSKYSHMGMLYKNGNELYVLEAVQPVKLTPLNKWIARGKNGHFVIKRLKEARKILTPKTLISIHKTAEKYIGRNYDIYFEWSDDRIYCSELVWKIFKNTLGIEIGKLQQGSDFDFTHPKVNSKLRERFPAGFPSNEKVISPEQMFHSNLLVTIYEN